MCAAARSALAGPLGAALSVVLALAAAVALCSLTACGALSAERADARPGPPGHRATITVPDDAPTIQGAVDAAVPGDLVLVTAGVYREDVTIDTPRIVLRGSDRDAVVIDGEGRRDTGVTVTAPEVAVENLTVRGHRADGVAFDGAAEQPLTGYRVSYLTAHGNHRHGVHARHARRGLVEHTHALAAADAGSGIHIEHCPRCESVVRENVADPVTLLDAEDVRVVGTAGGEGARQMAGGAPPGGDEGPTGQPERPGEEDDEPRPAVGRPS